MIEAKKFLFGDKVSISQERERGGYDPEHPNGKPEILTHRFHLEKALEIAYLEGIIDGRPDEYTGEIFFTLNGEQIDNINTVFDKLKVLRNES